MEPKTDTRKLKIVHLIFSLTSGGSEVLTVDLINQMCIENDVSLIIVNNLYSESLLKKIDKKVKVYKLNRKRKSKNPLPIINLNLLLLRLKPDIVHCHNSNIAGIIFLKKIKLLYTLHTMGINPTYFHRYNKLIAISDAVKNDVLSPEKYNIETITNGVNTKLFESRTNHTLNIDEPLKLIQVGRLVHEIKGQDVLLHALKILKDVYKINNFTLDIVGGGSAYYDSYSFLKDLVTSLDLQDHVHFLGDKEREWIYDNLCTYHILAQPSRLEGFGLTAIEGLAAGLPVLASNIHGLSEVLSQIKGGFLFTNEDAADCALKITNIINAYKNNQIDALIKDSKEIIEHEYSIENCVKKYLNAYVK